MQHLCMHVLICTQVCMYVGMYAFMSVYACIFHVLWDNNENKPTYMQTNIQITYKLFLVYFIWVVE